MLIYFDEATLFTKEEYLQVFERLRAGGLRPEQGDGEVSLVPCDPTNTDPALAAFHEPRDSEEQE